MSKTQNIYELMINTMGALCQSESRNGKNESNWQTFLRSAAWNYKYDFSAQVLIYAQRPDATACATFEDWTSPSKLNRRIRAKSTGIAILEDNRPELSLKYLYDISDTVARQNSMPVPIWHMTDEKVPAVREALLSDFMLQPANAPEQNMGETDFFRSVSLSIVKEEMPDLLPELLSARSEGAFDGLTDEDVEEKVETLLVNSITAASMYRCELSPKLGSNAFDAVQYLQGSALTTIGNTTQKLTRELLKTVARTIRNWDRVHKEEKQHDQSRDHVSAGRGVLAPEHSNPRTTESEPVRTASLETLEGDPIQSVHVSVNDRSAHDTPPAGRGGDSKEGGRLHGAASEGESNAQGEQADQGDVPGTAETGGRDGDLATDRIRTVSDEDVLFALRQGGRMMDSKYRIVQAANMEHATALENRLKSEYGITRQDGISFHYPDHKLGFIEPTPTGLKINKAMERSQVLSWFEVADRVSWDVFEGNYLTETEKAVFPTWEKDQADKEARGVLSDEINLFFAEQTLTGKAIRDVKEYSRIAELTRAFHYENSTVARKDLVQSLQAAVSNAEPHTLRGMAEELLQKLNALNGSQVIPSAYDAGIHTNLPTEAEQDMQDDSAVSLSQIAKSDLDYIFREFTAGDNHALLTAVLEAENDEDAGTVFEQVRHHVNSSMLLLPDGNSATLSFEQAGIRISAGEMKQTMTYPEAAHYIRQVRSLPKDMSQEAEQQPLRAEDLKAGDVITLPGGKYLVESISKTTATLQILDNPLFTQQMPLSLLNTLLYNMHAGKQAELLHTSNDNESERDQPSISPQYDVRIAPNGEDSSVHVSVEPHEKPLKDAQSILSTVDDVQLAEAGKTAIEALLSENEDLREDIHEELSAQSTSPVSRSSYAARAYDFMMRYAPEILDDSRQDRWRALRLEDSVFEPVNIERITEDQIAISHTYQDPFGDTYCDPEMTFLIDHKTRTLRPLTFEQSDLSIYQEVYRRDDISHRNPNRALEKELLSFFMTWYKNLEAQGHTRVYAITMDDERIDLQKRDITFDLRIRPIRQENGLPGIGTYIVPHSEPLPETESIQSTWPNEEAAEEGLAALRQKMQNSPAYERILLNQLPASSRNLFQGPGTQKRRSDADIPKDGTFDLRITFSLRDPDSRTLYPYISERGVSQQSSERQNTEVLFGSYRTYGSAMNALRDFTTRLQETPGMATAMSSMLLGHYEDANSEVPVDISASHTKLAAAGIRQDIPPYAGDILLAKEAPDGFLKASREEIREYFREYPDADDRISYLKSSVYAPDTFYEFGPEGKDGEGRDRKGLVAREEGVTIWIGGTYPSANERITLDWTSVQGVIDLTLQKDLGSDRAPTIFDFVAPTPFSAPLPPAVEREATIEPDIEKEEEQDDSKPAGNYRIGPVSRSLGGPKSRFQSNIAAIRLLKTLEEEDRPATRAEQRVLDNYVGWGGLADAFDPRNKSWKIEYEELKSLLTDEEYESARESTLTAFYTPPEVTHAIYDGLAKLGFQRGNILDPCCGTGKFLGALPESMSKSRLFAVEKDSISGRIAKKLYPDANIQIQGYEDTALQDNLFDVAIGNVPFGDFKLHDPRYNKQNLLIHDYFFAKTLDKVRPGGVIAFITSQGTMDKKNSKFREYLSQRADLLGAIRLPDDTFGGNAGRGGLTTDILFLQKREQPAVERANWVDLDRYLLEDPATGLPLRDRKTNEYQWSPEMNQYFTDHREMLLGTMQEVSGPYGPQTSCVPHPGHDLASELQEAISHLSGSMQLRQEEILDTEDKPARKVLPADPSVKNFSFTIVDDELYFREDSEMYEVQTNKMAMQRIRGMVELRNTLYSLIDAQLENVSDEEVEDLQRQLNTQYDAFVDKFGRINTRGNDLAFSDDSSYYLLCSLENLDEKTGEFVSKADIFFKRTIDAREPVSHTETSKEALIVSMSERGAIDFGFMTKLCLKDEETLKEELRGEIYPDPEKGGKYVLAATYLSGNIRQKLKAAQEAASREPDLYGPNVKALENAIPAPLEPGDISVRLGATWIPEDVITEFMYELLDTRDHYRITSDYPWSQIAAFYNEVTNTWTIKNKDNDSYNQKATKTYGTSRASAYRLIEDCLNLKNTKIFDTKYEHGKDKRVLNTQDTLEAQDKQEAIQHAFQDWIWKDVDRAERLAAIYNEKYNSYRPPVYDGDMVVFHGMNPNIELRPHQKNAVARMLFGGNTLLDHDVGAGKTWTMVGAAMEGKYLGLCNKTIITVPNHLVGQWASAVYQLYPAANILAATRRDFQTNNRKKFCSRIATGDYDIVIIGHSQFGLIPLSKERQQAGLEKQIDDISDAIVKAKEENSEGFTIKQMERMRKQIETKLQKLMDKKHDDVITFEQLGADRLYVDESHKFKNLFMYTKMSNVAGVSQTDSQKASDLFLKCRYMDELTGYKGTAFATGTAISNTMAEMYTVQRYLQYNVLQEAGLADFDAWAALFGEVVNAIELAPEGNGFRARTRFASFNNLPELLSMYHLVADTQTREMMDLPLPEVNFKTIPLPPSEEQKKYVKTYGERAERIRQGGVDPSEDNMLCITNDGRKLALDQRLIDPSLPDNPNSKVNVCVNLAYEAWKKGMDKKLTQVIFCDISTPKKGTFNVYDDLKQKLVAKGIPEDEIRFVHEANTETQKEALFSQVRNGDVRILMGSTEKLGTGTNIQNKLKDLYDLDCPWRPSDLEQRLGRGARQGNTNDIVNVTRIVTEGTFDAYMYQLMEVKQRFISQIRNGSFTGRSAADVDQATLNYAEIKALSAGDPRIREKVELEIDVSKLSVLYARHKNNQLHLQRLIQKVLPNRMEESALAISKMDQDLATLSKHPAMDEEGNLVKADVHGCHFDTLEESGKALFDALDKIPTGKPVVLGTIRGIAIKGVHPNKDEKDEFSIHPYFILGNETQIPVSSINNFSKDGKLTDVGLMRRLHHVLDNMPHRCSEEKESLRNSEQLMATSKSEYGKPFDREAELYEKQARLEVLNELLDLDRQNEQRDEDEIAVEPNQPVVSSVSAPVVLDSMTEEKSAYAEQNAEQEEKTYHSLSELLRNAADRQSHQATHESGPSVEQQRS